MTGSQSKDKDKLVKVMKRSDEKEEKGKARRYREDFVTTGSTIVKEK